MIAQHISIRSEATLLIYAKPVNLEEFRVVFMKLLIPGTQEYDLINGTGLRFSDSSF